MFQKLFCLFVMIFFCCLTSQIQAQKKTAVISGVVLNEEDKPLVGVTVQVLNIEKKTITNDIGYFKINITAGKPLALIFS